VFDAVLPPELAQFKPALENVRVHADEKLPAFWKLSQWFVPVIHHGD
jgi:hypothetical protein